MVWRVLAFIGALRTRAMTSGVPQAVSTLPMLVAWTGARPPTRDDMMMLDGPVHFVHVDSLRPGEHGQVTGLPGGAGELLEGRLRGAVQAPFVNGSGAQLEELYAQPVASSGIVTFDESMRDQRHQEPVHGALRQLDPLCNIPEADIALVGRE